MTKVCAHVYVQLKISNDGRKVILLDFIIMIGNIKVGRPYIREWIDNNIGLGLDWCRLHQLNYSVQTEPNGTR